MKIYGLFDKRDPSIIVYVGSTSRRLSSRLEDHLDKPSPKVGAWIKEIGRKNVGITLLEKCEIYERAERELWHMSCYSDLLNVKTPVAHPSDKKKRPPRLSFRFYPKRKRK